MGVDDIPRHFSELSFDVTGLEDKGAIEINPTCTPGDVDHFCDLPKLCLLDVGFGASILKGACCRLGNEHYDCGPEAFAMTFLEEVRSCCRQNRLICLHKFLVPRKQAGI